MEILFKDENIVAVYKEAGIPSQPDPSGDADAMTLCSSQLAETGEKSTELFLVHRLDRVVGGVLVFARNKKYAAILSEAVADRSAEKEYLAVVEGDAPGGILTDLIFKDARAGKAFVVDRKRAGVKEASLEYKLIEKTQIDSRILSLVRVKLQTGRFHQIRAQFSSRKMPIVGDGKYGSRDNVARMPALFAFRFSVSTKSQKYEFTKIPDKENYPWSLFNYD